MRSLPKKNWVSLSKILDIVNIYIYIIFFFANINRIFLTHRRKERLLVLLLWGKFFNIRKRDFFSNSHGDCLPLPTISISTVYFLTFLFLSTTKICSFNLPATYIHIFLLPSPKKKIRKKTVGIWLKKFMPLNCV